MNITRKRLSNSELFPEAWKVFVDCVRKWKDNDINKYPTGWKYGIPKAMNTNDYLYSDCPGKLFIKFKESFYNDSEIVKFRKFLWWLEMMEGKMHPTEYHQKNKKVVVF